MSIRQVKCKQRDALLAAGLFVAGIATRIPFTSRMLYHWDSVNFALALSKFDVRLHQPHPPGTFVIYIMLGRFINWFLHDPNMSLVWVSILSSGLATALIFALGRRWFGRRVGLTSAVLMLSSPLVWFHGEVALSYMLEFVWVVALILLCSNLHTGSEWALFISALLMGLAGGVRPNTPVFLFPLWVFSVRKFPLWKVAAALAVMVAGVAIWAVPMVEMSGGLTAYWEQFQWWRGAHTEVSGSLEGVFMNGARFGVFATYALGMGLVPVLLAVRWRLRESPRLLLKDWRAQTLVLWIAPAAAYFVFIHVMQSGHIFTMVPALVVIAGFAVVDIANRWSDNTRGVWIGLTVLVVSCNSFFFLLGPQNLFGSSRSVFSTPTWTAIREYDADIAARLEAIRDTFQPEETVVLATSRNFRLPDFYLRDFQLTSLSYRLGRDVVVLPEHVRMLVLFDDSVLPHLPAGSSIRSLPLPRGKSMRYVTWDEGQYVELSQASLDIQAR